MPAWKITPRTNCCCKEQAGACKHQKRFLSPLRTAPTRRHREVQRVATSPWGGSFPSAVLGGDVSGCSDGPRGYMGKRWSRSAPSRYGEHHRHPRERQNFANNDISFSSGRTKNNWKNQFSWENSSQVLLK